MRPAGLIPLLALAGAPILCAQAAGPDVLAAQAVITIPPQQCVWHAGDDPAWAAPNLDESGWQPYVEWKVDASQTYMWVRCQMSLASLRSLDHPALQVHLDAASQVFVDGALVGGGGNMASGAYSGDDFYAIPLARSSLTPSAVIALRIMFRDLRHGPAEILLGDQQSLGEHRDSRALAGAVKYLPLGLCFALIGVAGFMLLGLYLTDRSRTDLLLLAFVCWCLFILRACEFCWAALVPLPSGFLCIAYSLGELESVPLVWFFFRIAGKRVPWLYLIAVALTLGFFIDLFGTAVLPAGLSLRLDALYNSWINVFFVASLLTVTAPVAAFWPWNRVARNLRAVAGFCLLWAIADGCWYTIHIVSALKGIIFVTVNLAVFALFFRATITLCCVLALVTILFREQRKIAADRALLAGEMDAAREIQRYLIPEKLPPTPGLTIHSVYHPSREVGGDFFQVLPDTRDGSTLIVVGDVAGKGLKAGMLAALIVGAIRTAFQFTSEPGRILALLNERLQGRGLVTCLAMRIDRDGNAELANAGQLPPYVNGNEIALEGSLPLGALPALSFSTARLKLGKGESMLFVSDGVVEARNAQRELFGFERAAKLSTEPAEKVAEAAQAFGQEDDITVLTLSLAPAEVVHA